MRRVWIVAQRELKALFDYPTAYVLLVVFLGVNAFLFFRQAYVGGAASLRPMLDLLPWVLLFFVPAVTMRTVAEDSRNGILEVVLAQPLTELELLGGKYLGSLLFLWISLALTLPIPLALSLGAHLQWGPILAQYIGSALLMAGFAGVGIWASTIASSQMTAFIISVVVMFILVLFGLDPLIVGLPPNLGAIAARLGVLSHFDSISRGVIDLRDAIYFISLAGVFLALAYGSLVRRKLAPAGGAARRLRLGVGLITATLIVVNLLGSYIRGRLDLTPGHAYTLSPATVQIVKGLDDIVTIKVFASKELPTEAALLKRDVDDLLHDLKSAGGGKVRIVQRDPAESESARKDAQAMGIQAVQFNVIGQSELQVKEGYLGLAIQHADGNETIPFVSQTEDLEYRLASAIRSLTRTKKPVVGLVNEAKEPDAGLGTLREQLVKGYEVREVTLGDTGQVAKDVSVLILAGNPDSLPSVQLDRLNQFFDRGGSALVLASGMELSPQMPVAMPKPVGWNAALKRFGASIRSDMVYDLQASEIVPVPSDAGRVLRQYPFFIRATSTGKSVINQEVGDAIFTWASSIDTVGSGNRTLTPLFATTRAAGASTGETMIDPGRDFSQSDLKPRLLAVQAIAGKNQQDRNTPGRNTAGRVVIIGDALFASDRSARGAPENLAVALNSVDWLAQDEALISIRAKDRRPPPLVFTSDLEREGAKYLNVIGIPLLVVAAGMLHLVQRRRKTREPYRPLVPAESKAA
jgi:ABC-type uncharacterized transport system involved in gliding motility auxiliary subunit/ABC-type transport system involved in multi-copper enzyme maturation permease subunit